MDFYKKRFSVMKAMVDWHIGFQLHDRNVVLGSQISEAVRDLSEEQRNRKEGDLLQLEWMQMASSFFSFTAICHLFISVSHKPGDNRDIVMV